MPKPMIMPREFLHMCRRRMRAVKIADTTGVSMTGASLLMRTLIFRRLLLREILGPDEKFVGLLVPPSAGAVLANIAVPLCGRVPVNLNYTVSSDVMNSCIRQANIKHVLTSRKVLERFKLDIDAELVFLEDFRNKVTTMDKLVAAFQTYACPLSILERQLGVDKIKDDDLLTVIFTSGSTGEPKGVMLTQRNVASNVECVDYLLQLHSGDCVAGILPFFHSTGFTTTLWTALSLDPKGAYHTSPLEARQVGEMCRKENVTILVSAPTFLRNYLRRCPAEDFAGVEMVLTGAEKLPIELSEAFEQKFGVRPGEGYGTTELSPIVAFHVPKTRVTKPSQLTCKEGTVGHPIPDVQVKAVNPDTGEDLGPNEEGVLWFKGPNVMKGYLNRPDLTAKVIKNGWYNSGDVGLVTSDGCIKITGRQSRFSKIGGEMVPHIKIEETLQTVTAADPDELTFAVTGVPDPTRGERLVVLYTDLPRAPDEICRELAGQGLPNIWIPSPDSFCKVEAIPVLGTGKLDLRGLKDLALERFGGEAAGARS
ncbi:MAG TPA: AMP-binding protein [Pirellulales bacterium]|jgi:acyl-[acyl-carrier-protein]-phospholipid O-acyltransferase/long-chain-fatty-acid--[acyl-carrier-protein] ligase